MRKTFVKYAAAVLSAAALTACVRDTTATMLYDNEYSPLTRMQYSTTVPPETYSEYMATFTSLSETDTNDYYYSLFRNDGVIADTRVAAPPENGSGESLQRDTAVPRADTSVTGDIPRAEETSVPDSFFTEETETCVTGEAVQPPGTAFVLEPPEADTGINEKVSADTMVKPTAPSEETTAESSLSE